MTTKNVKVHSTHRPVSSQFALIAGAHQAMKQAMKQALTALVAWLSRRSAGMAVLAIIITVLLVSVLMATRPDASSAAAQIKERVWPVEVIAARRQSIQPVLSVFGQVVPGRYSEMRALVPGLILDIGPAFREGAFIRKGGLLVRIDPFEYETTLSQREALLEEARTSLALLRLKHQRTESLYQKGTLSKQALDEAFLSMKQQQSVVAQAEIGVQRAQRSVAETRLLAPFDGVLNDVNANLGKEININDRVADLIDISNLEVKFSLSNAQFGRLLGKDEKIIGRPVKVYWQVGGQTLAFKARVERTDARISINAGGIGTYAVIQDSDPGKFLRPGAFVRVEISDQQYDDVVRAPDSVLYGDNIVYVVNADQRLEQRRITVVGHDGSHILFRSADGPPVKDGDRLVVTQLREAGVGAKVDVRS